jgi:hypothetical protein
MSTQDQSGKTPKHRYSASRGQLAAIWSQAGFQHHRRQFAIRTASLKVDSTNPQGAMFADDSREDRRTIESCIEAHVSRHVENMSWQEPDPAQHCTSSDGALRLSRSDVIHLAVHDE